MKVKRSKQRKKATKKKIQKKRKDHNLMSKWVFLMSDDVNRKKRRNVLSVKKRLSAYFNVDYRLELTSRRVCRGHFGATLFEVIF